jgi:hypothetical protein
VQRVGSLDHARAGGEVAGREQSDRHAGVPAWRNRRGGRK